MPAQALRDETSSGRKDDAAEDVRRFTSNPVSRPGDVWQIGALASSVAMPRIRPSSERVDGGVLQAIVLHLATTATSGTTRTPSLIGDAPMRVFANLLMGRECPGSGQSPDSSTREQSFLPGRLARLDRTQAGGASPGMSGTRAGPRRLERALAPASSSSSTSTGRTRRRAGRTKFVPCIYARRTHLRGDGTRCRWHAQ